LSGDSSIFGSRLSEIAFISALSLFFLELLTKLIAHLYVPCLLVLRLELFVLIPLFLIVIAPLTPYVLDKLWNGEFTIGSLRWPIFLIVAARLSSPLFDNLWE